ncbi:MAG: HNH endonuclease [Ignavibacteriales bacterium]|nr:HNH endonuclease [Ignavibacteriales bacterium]
MPFDDETIELVFEKANGKCHYCGKQLSWANYGRRDARGGWEIDHSFPRSRGGTDHLNNLVPSCWTCNLDKSNTSSKQFKRYAEPLKRDRKKKRIEKTVTEILGIAAIGALLIIGAKMLSNWLDKSNQSDNPPNP